MTQENVSYFEVKFLFSIIRTITYHINIRRHWKFFRNNVPFPPPLGGQPLLMFILLSPRIPKLLRRQTLCTISKCKCPVGMHATIGSNQVPCDRSSFFVDKIAAYTILHILFEQWNLAVNKLH